MDKISSQVKGKGLTESSAESTQGKKNKIIDTRIGVSKIFLLTVILLVALGTVMIFSASYAYAGTYLGDSYHFIKSHIKNLVIGFIAMFIMAKVDYRFLKVFAPHIFLLAYGLMLFVTLSGFGSTSKGAERWINIGFSFQPSEFFKLAIIIFLAYYISKYHEKITAGTKKEQWFFGLWAYLILAAIIVVPYLFQKHLSGTVITLGLLVCMMLIGGSQLKLIIGLVLTGVAGLACLIPVAFQHAQARLIAWWNPFRADLIMNEGWQPAQSQLAIASGGLWGLGFGASRQKQLYLPEPQNDYIFAILCEEMGFIGAFAVICIFMFLIYKGIIIAVRSPEKFSAMLGVGIMFQVGLQAILNILVVAGWLPSTGISLPFFSYGGSSLIFLLAEMGIMLNISSHALVEVQ